MARFCHAPFLQVKIHGDGHYAPCCNLWMPEKTRTYKEYLKSPTLLKLKEDFRNEIEPDACTRCWANEANGLRSMRQDIEFDMEITNNSIDLDEPIHSPQSVQLIVSTTCNLKCRICDHNSSHLLGKEHNLLVDLGARENKVQATARRFLANPEYTSWLQNNNQDLRHLQLLGGEPWMDLIPQQIELLESIQYPETVSLTYITNGTLWPPDEILELWKTFQRTNIIVSTDGTGHVFEYSRFPAKWEDVEANTLRYNEFAKQNDNVFCILNNTVSILNVLNLPDYVAWANLHGLDAPPAMLSYPAYYNIYCMSLPVRQYIADVLNSTKETKHLVQPLLNSKREDMTNEFREELLLLDSVRNQSYKTLYPPEFIKLLGL